ncbi:hypothetical protein D9M68_638170 [compost metagenome]
MLDLDQPGDAVHQHTGFAGAGTSQHQLPAQAGRYGLALSIVEGVQEKREIVAHRGILGGGGRQGKPHMSRRAERVLADDRPVTWPYACHVPRGPSKVR